MVKMASSLPSVQQLLLFMGRERRMLPWCFSSPLSSIKALNRRYFQWIWIDLWKWCSQSTILKTSDFKGRQTVALQLNKKKCEVGIADSIFIKMFMLFSYCVFWHGDMIQLNITEVCNCHKMMALVTLLPKCAQWMRFFVWLPNLYALS